jgi:hypothetical protein
MTSSDATGSGASALGNTRPVTDKSVIVAAGLSTARGRRDLPAWVAVRSPPPWRSLCQVSGVQCFCRRTQQVGDFSLGEFCYAHFLNAVHDQRNYSIKPVCVRLGCFLFFHSREAPGLFLLDGGQSPGEEIIRHVHLELASGLIGSSRRFAASRPSPKRLPLRRECPTRVSIVASELVA